MFVETHLDEEGAAEVQASVRKDGWKLIAAPARASGRSESGASAGETVLARTRVATSSFDYLA
eukprot:9090495-Pyramimonas_sp.AAC.1